MDVIFKLLVSLIFTICLYSFSSSAPLKKSYTVMCYYDKYSPMYNYPTKLVVPKIDTKYCTHLVYSFLTVDSEYQLTTMNEQAESYSTAMQMKFFNELKTNNSQLKTLLCVEDPDEEKTVFSAISSDKNKIKNFIQSAIRLIEEVGFDGLDIVSVRAHF